MIPEGFLDGSIGKTLCYALARPREAIANADCSPFLLDDSERF